MQRIVSCSAVLLLLAATGCSNLDSTEQRMLSGGAIGAGAGAVVGAMTGGLSVVGASAIGAAAGAATGYIIDKESK